MWKVNFPQIIFIHLKLYIQIAKKLSIKDYFRHEFLFFCVRLKQDCDPLKIRSEKFENFSKGLNYQKIGNNTPSLAKFRNLLLQKYNNDVTNFSERTQERNRKNYS